MPPRRRRSTRGDLSIGSGVIRVAAANLSTAAAAAVATPLITHSIGVSGQGVTTGATAPLLLVSSAATLGIPSAVTYAVARDPRLLKWLFPRAVVATALVGLAMTVGVIAFASLLSGGHTSTAHLMALMSIFIVPSLLVGVLRGAALGLRRWRCVAAEQAISAGVMLIGALALFLAGHLTVALAALLLSASPVCGAVAYFPLAHPLRQPGTPFALREARHLRLINYSARVWVGSITGIVLARLDQSLMVPLSNPHQLGLYSIATNISEVTLLINAAIANVMFAVESADQDADRLTRAGRISTIVVVLGSVCMALGATVLIGPIFGTGFRAALLPLFVLLFAVALGNPGSVAGAGLQARGLPGRRSLALAVACVVNATAVVVLVPPLGAMGAALATVLGNLVSSNLVLLFLHRHAGISPLRFYVIRKSDITYLVTRARQLFGRISPARPSEVVS